MNAFPMLYHSAWHQSTQRDMPICPKHNSDHEYPLTPTGIAYWCSNGSHALYPSEVLHLKEPACLTRLHG